MNKIILILSIILPACAMSANAKRDDAFLQQLAQRDAQRDEEIADLKRQLADKQQPQQEASKEDASVAAPAPAPAPMPSNVRVSQVKQVVRRAPQVYMANVGTVNRDLSNEWHQDVVNWVCMANKRDMGVCDPKDGEFLGFELEDGKQAMFQSSAYRTRPDGTMEPLLAPNKTAHIRVGPDPFMLTIKVYHRKFVDGNPLLPVYSLYKTYVVPEALDAKKGKRYEMDELRY